MCQLLVQEVKYTSCSEQLKILIWGEISVFSEEGSTFFREDGEFCIAQWRQFLIGSPCILLGWSKDSIIALYRAPSFSPHITVALLPVFAIGGEGSRGHYSYY